MRTRRPSHRLCRALRLWSHSAERDGANGVLWRCRFCAREWSTRTEDFENIQSHNRDRKHLFHFFAIYFVAIWFGVYLVDHFYLGGPD